MITREKDEIVLRMIRMRVLGFSLAEIGKRFGKRYTEIGRLTNAVCDADVEHCGEHVKSHYWPRKTPV